MIPLERLGTTLGLEYFGMLICQKAISYIPCQSREILRQMASRLYSLFNYSRVPCYSVDR
jgi:hypothetical protein